MNPLYWIAWSCMCAAVTGVLVFFVMQSRMEVILARQREELADARATIRSQKDTLDNSLRSFEEAVRRKAMDEFLAEIRVEERYYVREQKALMVNRKSMIRQERIFFRNVPLSSWMEHEMPLEEGADIEKIAQGVSMIASESFQDAVKLLR